MKGPLLLGSVLTVGILLAGCQSEIAGSPVTSPPAPTEPSFPTARPTRSSPVPAPSTDVAAPPSAPSAQPPGGATTLQPVNGYVFIETRSGKTRCQLTEEDVGCESVFPDAPDIDGTPANGVRLDASGEISWVLGNLGDIPAVTLDYRRYHAMGWTIDASAEGTRFTNDSSGHGMVVAVEGVQTF